MNKSGFSLSQSCALNESIDSWALAHGNLAHLTSLNLIRMQWHLTGDSDTMSLYRRRKLYMGSRKIAVLIDSDNTPRSKLSSFIEELPSCGQIIVKRAYGDFSTE